MGVQGVVAWVVGNKVVAALTAGAVLTAGGAALAVTTLDDGPPTVEVEPLEAAPTPTGPEEQDDVAEPSLDVPDPARAEEHDTSGSIDGWEAAVGRQPIAEDDPAPEEDPAPEGKADGDAGDKGDGAVRSGVDLAVSLSGTSDRTVVQVHNLGDAVSGPVKVRYEGREGASGTVEVLEASDNATECRGSDCWFDGLGPGVEVATVVFAVTGVACSHGDGGGKVTVHYGGDDRTWDNNHGWVGWCEGKQLAGAADLGVHVSGAPDEYVVRVDNAGPAPAGRVKVKMHSVEGATGTIRVLGTEGPVVGCDGWYCYFEDVPVGDDVATVRFAVDVHECWSAAGGATVEVRSETDPNPADDHVRVPWCEGRDVTEKATTDLAVSIEGTAASYTVLVTNTGGEAATDVHLLHRTREGDTTVALLEASHPDHCGPEGCVLDELAPGASVWLRIEATVDCATSPATFAKAYVQSTSKDTLGDNDRATLALC